MDANIIDTTTALDIVVGILNGLTVLHSAPNYIVHRDLKPKNILIDNHTKTPIISDFGSIKIFDKNIGTVKASKCTHIYRPKEAVLDDVYTMQSDLYQVGIILFQLLGGRFPDLPTDWLNAKQKVKLSGISGNFEQWQFIESVFDKLIVSNKLLDLDSFPIYVNDKLKKLVKNATHNDLSKRYKTTSEFLNDIYRIQKKCVSYWIDNEITYAKTKKTQFRFYNVNKKGFVLECSKDEINWRKDNSHDGTELSIIKRIENLN
jgi:serine/threonine protein kinase